MKPLKFIKSIYHNHFFIASISFLFISFLTACKENTLDIDISDVQCDIRIERFDKDLMSCNTDSISECIPFLQKKYPDFFDIFNNRIINIGGPENKAYSDYLTKFITDPVIIEVYDYTEKIYPDINDIQSELNTAFRHFLKYFPDKKAPKVYTFISGFNQSIVTDANMLGIGLDKYLGENCPYYTRLGIPKYLQFKMHKGKIVTDCLTGWANMEFDYNDSIDNLLNRMIYNGKIQYFLDAMLPDVDDTIKFGYTTKQMQWCKANENNMWTYLVENKLLFNNEYMAIKKMIDDGPYTTYFPNNSPSRTGVWIGWRIIKSYIKNNPDVTFQQLMKETDYQKILNKSKYKPE